MLFSLAIFLCFIIVVARFVKLGLSRTPFSVKTIFTLIGAVFIVVGLFNWMVAVGGLTGILPDSFEWPVNEPESVLVTSHGTHIVPNGSSVRMQIYDRDLVFQRGWWVDTGGGGFKLVLSSDTSFTIYVDKYNEKHTYDLSGTLLATDPVDYVEYGNIRNEGTEMGIPTPPFRGLGMRATSGFILGLFGGFLLFLSVRDLIKQPNNK